MSCLGGSLRLWSAFVYFCFVFQIFKLGFKDNSFESDLQSVLDHLDHDVRDTTPIHPPSVERDRMPASSDLTLDHE